MKKIGILKEIFFVFIFATMVGGLIAEARYSLPYNDDFNFIATMNRSVNNGDLPIIAAINTARFYFENEYGGVVSVFLISFFDKFRLGDVSGTGVASTIGVLCFFCALLFLFRVMGLKIFNMNNAMTYEIFFVMIAGWLDTSTPEELFYWYCCIYEYLWGVTLIMIILALLILNNYNSKAKCRGSYITKLNFAIIVTLSVLVSGMSGQISMVITGLFFFLCIIGYISEVKTRIILGVSIIFPTIITNLCPGNVGRMDANASVNISFFERLIYGVYYFLRCIARIAIKDLFTSWFFWILIAIMVLYRLFTNDGMVASIRGGLVRFFAAFILIGTTVYPVLVGYQISFLSPRTKSVAMIVIWLLLIYLLFYISHFIKPIDFNGRNRNISFSGVIPTIIICLALVLYFTGDNYGLLAYTELLSGKPQQQWSDWEYIYETVNKSDESEVVININHDCMFDLMVKHDAVLIDYNDPNSGYRLANSYMDICGKDRIDINFSSDDGIYTLSGKKIVM